MFTPEMSGAGSDAKALAGAAQKALAGEISARANRLAHAADGQLVLSTEDIVRWLGQPVARLVAGEEPLKPRLRLLCDEHLEGAPRDAVQGRLELWLKTHIERILEPLFRLAAAEDITGMARGLAYQLIEAMGVLERQKVADEVKGLDQAARATLRKYGVRFGAYHIYCLASSTSSPCAGDAALGTEIGFSGGERRCGRRAGGRQRSHVHIGSEGRAEIALPGWGLPRLWRARRARGYPRADLPILFERRWRGAPARVKSPQAQSRALASPYLLP